MFLLLTTSYKLSMTKLKIKQYTITRKDNGEVTLPTHISKLVKITGERNDTAINAVKDDYYLASMFPNNDVMHRVYSIIKNLEEI